MHAPLWLTLIGCVQPAPVPTGAWTFEPSVVTFTTRLGAESTASVRVRNTSDTPLSLRISRPIPDGDCPEASVLVDSALRVAPNGSEDLRVVHRPTLWTDTAQCAFFIKLVQGDDPTIPGADERSLLVRGRLEDVDADCDGATRGRDGDCNDHGSDPIARLVSPFRQEACNGIDDDCDGLVDDNDINEAQQLRDGLKRGPGDEGSCTDHVDGGEVLRPPDDAAGPYVLGSTAWYPDADGDTWPALAAPTWACSRPYASQPAPCGDPILDPRSRLCTPCTAPGSPPGCVDLALAPDASDHNAGWDCNDGFPSMNPGAYDLVADGVDRDCDGLVTCFADGDGDGWGNAAVRALVDPRVQDPGCTGLDVLGAPVARAAGDCDDADASVSPSATERCDGGAGIDEDCDGLINDDDPLVDPTTTTRAWRDADQDGYGDLGDWRESCDGAPAGFVQVGGDCDDHDASVHPGRAELCNGRDDDCAGGADDGLAQVDLFPDLDGDGVGTFAGAVRGCEASLPGYAPLAGDCDDGDRFIAPGQPERCNAADDDCDGIVDNSPPLSIPQWWPDRDGDGDASPAATPVEACAPPPGMIADLDPTDCDDLDPDRHPGAPERCDGVDANCDGVVDDDLFADWRLDRDGDGFAADASPVVRACEPPADAVDAALTGDCDDLDPDRHPGAPERCDGVDANCDGVDDDDLTVAARPDRDLDGYGTAADAEVAVCVLQPGLVDATRVGDCDDLDPGRHPAAAEVCDGVDDDCDGDIDEGLPTSRWAPDADQDGAPAAGPVVDACAAPAGYRPAIGAPDCDDADPSRAPLLQERCNGRDDDCDDAVDLGAPCGPDAWRVAFDPPLDGGSGVYQLVDTPASWYQADLRCASMGYHLAWITTQDEHDGLVDAALQLLGYRTTPPAPPFTGARAWIGYRRGVCGPGWARVADGACADPLTTPERQALQPLVGEAAYLEVPATGPPAWRATLPAIEPLRFLCEAP